MIKKIDSKIEQVVAESKRNGTTTIITREQMEAVNEEMRKVRQEFIIKNFRSEQSAKNVILNT